MNGFYNCFYLNRTYTLIYSGLINILNTQMLCKIMSKGECIIKYKTKPFPVSSFNIPQILIVTALSSFHEHNILFEENVLVAHPSFGWMVPTLFYVTSGCCLFCHISFYVQRIVCVKGEACLLSRHHMCLVCMISLYSHPSIFSCFPFCPYTHTI